MARLPAVASICLFCLTGCGQVPPTGPPADDILTATLPGNVDVTFVWIGPGTFAMGSPDFEEGRLQAEGPQHQVEITAGFYLGKFEVTQRQWEAVMGTHPWRLTPPAQGPREGVQENPGHPAAYISWDFAQDFIQKLNDAVGDSLYRLPTEAEWEYAARAGTTTRWSFGDSEGQLAMHAWYWDNAWISDTVGEGEKYAHRVGAKLPNPWGLHDMHGNVYEWVQDWYLEDYYTVSPGRDPLGPASGEIRIIRGGSVASDATRTRSARRNGLPPGYTGNGEIGFRLLRRAD